ncbi:MAG: hypothetical protein HYZ14_13950 [Bacteroidetes bacterium]|nr:hypothetical protein [Bacteroidota bacterium]
MELNDTGKIARQYWLEIPNHFPNTILHDFIIMPDHVHGIIEIVGAEHLPPQTPVDTREINEVEHLPPQTPVDTLEINEVEHLPPQTPVDTQEINETENLPPQTPVDTREINETENLPPQTTNETGTKKDVENSPSKMIINTIDGNGAEDFPPLRGSSKTIGSIVRGFKIGVTKWVRSNLKIQDVWQRNYYEHIIRNQQAFDNMAEYIRQNPEKWDNE